MTETVSAILRDRRVLATVAALAILAVAAALVPRPSIIVVREWAESMGPSFVVVFFLTQAVLTIAPVPRTVFTLSAGLLFGPATGVAVTIAATTVSAVLALLLVRALGRTAVQERLTNPAVKSIDARLARRTTRRWLGDRRVAPTGGGVALGAVGALSKEATRETEREVAHAERHG